jgi:hypothetical protein
LAPHKYSSRAVANVKMRLGTALEPLRLRVLIALSASETRE